MTAYKVHFYSQQESSCGFSFFPTMADARMALAGFAKDRGDDFDRDRSQIETISIRVTIPGVLSALNRHGGHPDNV